MTNTSKTKWTKGPKRALRIVIIILAIVIMIVAISPDDGKRPEIVFNSPLDGSVSQVSKYLNKNLKDPKSYESIDWSPVYVDSFSQTARYVVRHKYRAKNSFNGYVVSNQIFYLDSAGNVIDVMEQ